MPECRRRTPRKFRILHPLWVIKVGVPLKQPQIHSEIVIDKIAVCIPAPKEFQGYFLSSVIEMQEKKDWPFKQFGLRAGARGSYRAGVKIHMPLTSDESGLGWSDEYVLLQASPRKELKHFFRVEWNPAKTGPIAVKRTAEAFATFVPGFEYEPILKLGHVTRLNIAVDLKGVTLDDYLWEAPKKQCRALYIHAGELSTAYLGRKRGNCVAIYDKRREMQLPDSTLSGVSAPETDLAG